LGKFDFSFNVLKETTDKLGFELYSLKFWIIRQKRCLRIQRWYRTIRVFQIATLDWMAVMKCPM
jgi:starch synthase